MREISSREYEDMVEGIIESSLEDGLMGAFDYITRNLGCIEDYDEREVAAENMRTAFQLGIEATWKEQAIELFEMYGMDVRKEL